MAMVGNFAYLPMTYFKWLLQVLDSGWNKWSDGTLSLYSWHSVSRGAGRVDHERNGWCRIIVSFPFAVFLTCKMHFCFIGNGRDCQWFYYVARSNTRWRME